MVGAALVLGVIGSAALAGDATDASRRLSDRSVGRDLSVTRQQLRTLKTTNPNSRSTPLLERQLHRTDRSLRVRRR
jgi:hypothetical protein